MGDLASDNHNLIYSFIRSRHLDKSEYYDIAAIGYMKSVNTYNSELGVPFAAYAFKCMQNEYVRYIRKNVKSAESVYGYVSLNVVVVEGDHNGTTIELQDTIEDTSIHICDDIVTDEYFKCFYKKLEPRDRFIVRKRLQGYTMEEIGGMLHITKARVGAILQAMCIKYKSGR